MKVLQLGIGFFKLPDDFTGGISDALRLLADYHDGHRSNCEVLSQQNDAALLGDERAELFGKFKEVVNDEKLATFGCNICELQADDTWKLLADSKD